MPRAGRWRCTATVTPRSTPSSTATPASVRGYTMDAAYLAGEENLKGSLEVGKLADLAVLSEDPTTVDPDRIRSLRVEATVSGGELAWHHESFPHPGSHR